MVSEITSKILFREKISKKTETLSRLFQPTAKLNCPSVIDWLNSGNFGIFQPSESILILNSSACRTLKTIQNDIKVGTIPWDLKVENPCLNFCVGE